MASDTCTNYLYRVTCLIDEGNKFALDASALKAVANEAYENKLELESFEKTIFMIRNVSMNEKTHTHNFVNQYLGLVGFGLDRETDLKSLMVYLQKFSDDTLLETLLPRLSQGEIDETVDLISRILKTHLSEEEYHCLFLKEDPAQEGFLEESAQDLRKGTKECIEPGEDQLRWLCRKQGLDWDLMSEEERQSFIIDISRV
jgi:hypothetical protein